MSGGHSALKGITLSKALWWRQPCAHSPKLVKETLIWLDRWTPTNCVWGFQQSLLVAPCCRDGFHVPVFVDALCV